MDCGATQLRGHDGQVKQGEQEFLHARDSVGQTSGATQVASILDSARLSLFQSQHLNAPVLSEMVIEGKGPSDATTIEHGERHRITEGPVLIDVSSEDL